MKRSIKPNIMNKTVARLHVRFESASCFEVPIRLHPAAKAQKTKPWGALDPVKRPTNPTGPSVQSQSLARSLAWKRASKQMGWSSSGRTLSALAESRARATAFSVRNGHSTEYRLQSNNRNRLDGSSGTLRLDESGRSRGWVSDEESHGPPPDGVDVWRRASGFQASPPAGNVGQPVFTGLKTSAAEYSGFTIYLREIGQIPRLTLEEELELAGRVRQGDEEARDLMIKANLRLVVKIARQYDGMGVPLLDLVNEGNIGLMKAVERFDPAKGAKLSSYAALWIRQGIKRALCNQRRDVRLPVHVQEKLQQIQDCILTMIKQWGRTPTPEEISRATGFPARKILRMLEAAQGPASLNTPVSEAEEGAELRDVILDEKARDPYEELERGDAIAILGRFMGELKPREWDILKWRFGLEGGPLETLDQIGERLRLTREAVRQIQNRALEKLRKCFKRMERVHTLGTA
jgi:RNA polymerase primary sigma factor